MTVCNKSLMYVVHCEAQETAMGCIILIARDTGNNNATKWIMEFSWTKFLLLSAAHDVVHTGIVSPRLICTNDPVALAITEY